MLIRINAFNDTKLHFNYLFSLNMSWKNYEWQVLSYVRQKIVPIFLWQLRVNTEPRNLFIEKEYYIIIHFSCKGAITSFFITIGMDNLILIFFKT